MNPAQERFAHEYVVDYNGTQAAIRAGYSAKTAYAQANKLLKNAEILTRVRELQKAQVERLAISADWVVVKLLETLDQCMQAVPVLVWDSDARCKVESGEYVFDSKGALRALELIGKHLGMFTDKIEHSGGVEVKQDALATILEQLK